MSDVLAMGWGQLLDTRRGDRSGLEAFIQFANEEAPRWLPYTELAAHRRALLTAKRMALPR